MSFIGDVEKGQVYAPGYFLAHEECVRETRQIAQEGAETVGTKKIVKMGTVYPSVGSSAEGIVYEDVDVTSGDMPASVVTQGIVVKDRIPLSTQQLTASTLTALTAKDFKFVDEPAVTRP